MEPSSALGTPKPFPGHRGMGLFLAAFAATLALGEVKATLQVLR